MYSKYFNLILFNQVRFANEINIRVKLWFTSTRSDSYEQYIEALGQALPCPFLAKTLCTYRLNEKKEKGKHDLHYGIEIGTHTFDHAVDVGSTVAKATIFQ